jgi:hypothetical protein
MPELPVADRALVQCLQASVASVDPSLDDIAIIRIFPVVICVDVMDADGEIDQVAAMDLADQVRDDINALLEAFDCELIGEFGPLDGSRLWSLFYRTKNAEKRADAATRDKAVSDALKPKLRNVVTAGGNVAKIGTAVGGIVVVVTTGSAIASTLGVPVAAYVVLMSAGPAVTIIESIKKLFFGD